MKRPTITLQIAGHPWSVQLVKGLGTEKNLFGQTMYPNRIIEIDADLREDCFEETLFHECLHAVAFEYGISLKEKHVRTLGLGLHQMLSPFFNLPKRPKQETDKKAKKKRSKK